MKKNRLLYCLWGLIAIGLLLPSAVNAQTQDDTGTFSPVIDGSNDDVVIYASVNPLSSTDATLCFGGSSTSKTGYDKFSTLCRFLGPSTPIDVRDGGGYVKDNSVIPESGTVYHVWTVIHFATKTYDTYIREGSGSIITIRENAGFRDKSDLTISSIDTWYLIHNGGSAASVNAVGFADTVGVLPKSAALSGIALSAGSLDPAFDSAITSYDVALPYGTTSVDITATPYVKGADIVGDSTLDISAGEDTVDIVVTAVDSITTKTYTLNFAVDPGDTVTTLSSLASSIGTLSPAFDPEVLSYTVDLANSVTSVDVTATTTVPEASTAGDGTIDVSSSTSANIVVTAKNGTDERTYTVNFNKLPASTDTTLSALTFDYGYLKGVFDSGTDTYEVLVPAGSSTVNVTATPTHEFATVTSGDGAIDVSGGSTSTVINMEAEDGSTGAYTVNFTVDLTNHMFGWDGDGHTGTGSEPNSFGWENTAGDAPWGEANVGGCRFRDDPEQSPGVPYTYEDGGATVTGRQFLLRYDGSTASETSAFTYPVMLEADSVYKFSFDYVYGGSGTPPATLTVGIGTSNDATSDVASKGFETASNTTQYRSDSLIFMTDAAGVYYVKFTCSEKSWQGVNNLSLEGFTSSDATLSDLTVNDGDLDPVFDSGTTSYSLLIDPNLDTLFITATPTIEFSTVTGADTVLIEADSGEAVVTVTALDGVTTQDYTINWLVGLDSADATLSAIDLSVNGLSLDPAFHPDSLTYTVDVPASVSSVDLTATPTVSGVTTVGDSTIDVSDSVSIDIVVTALNETDTRTYTINFNKLTASADAALSDISFDFGYLKGVFDSGTTTYEVLVPAGASAVNVTATPTDQFATVTSGDGAIDVSGGSTSTDIIVTAEDGSTTSTYTVNFTVDATNYMFGWDGDGHTGTGSEADNFGWQCTVINSDGWTQANVFGVRFQDNVSYATGRVLYTRWDNVNGTNTGSIYAYPVSLEAGFYQFTARMGWAAEGSTPDYTYQINSVADNTGDTLAVNSLNVPATGVLHDMQLAFEVVSPGTYYFTLGSSSGVLGAITELNLEDVSTDANLSALLVNDGTLDPVFHADSTAYTLLMPPGSDTLIISATAYSSLAAIAGADTIALPGTTGTETVTVTAADGTTTKDYVIDWEVETVSSDATLSDLSIDAGLSLSPAFSAAITDYTVEYNYTVESTYITAVENYSEATVEGDTGTFVLSDGAVATITVTAENGSTQDYTITFNKDPNLIALWDGNGATGTNSEPDNFGWVCSDSIGWTEANQFGIRFEDGVSYATSRALFTRWDNVNNATTSSIYAYPATLEPGYYLFTAKSAWHANASAPDYSYLINSASDNTGDTLAYDVLNVPNTGQLYDMELAFEVTSAGTYYFTLGSSTAVLGAITDLHLEAFTSSDATLSDIALSSGSLDPVFDSATVSYNVELPYGTTSVDVTATPTISISDVVGGGTIDVSSGSGTTDIVVTAIDGETTKTYTIDFAVDQGDTLATLSDIALSVGSLDPVFNSDSLTYHVDVPFGTTSVDVTATATVSGATVVGDGTIDVSSGSGTADIVVTATDGTTTRTYTVDITVSAISTDATLADISFDFGYLKGAFDSSTTTYEVLVPAGVSSVNVTATESDTTATIDSGDGLIDVTGTSPSTVINITAQDGTTTEAYTLNFTVDATNYMFGWDGDGVTGAGSEADNYGWQCTKIGEWVEAGAFGARFQDDQSYAYDGGTLDGRLLFVRWDGAEKGTDPKSDITSIYSYPAVLSPGYYLFTAKMAWNNNASAPDYTFQINTAADNTGDTLTMEVLNVPNKTEYYDVQLGFEVTTAGTYYLTLGSSTAVLGAITDLNLETTEETDGDGIPDAVDNCPATANADQADLDGDDIGDTCDDDIDGDGVLNADDAFPLDETEDTDTDGDGTGNNADTDDDGDGTPDVDDAFPLDETEDTDTDGDGIGNNADTDDDGDGQSDAHETTCGSDPLDSASTSTDSDSDGVPDCVVNEDDDSDGITNGEDNCPGTANEDQADMDGDGIGDVCDDDRDGDGTANAEDAFPDDPAEDTDTDGDGTGDNADTDDDGDGQSDEDEIACGSDPLDSGSLSQDADSDGTPDCIEILDDDGDGVANGDDNCPDTANADQADQDGDGIGDVCDDDFVVLNLDDSDKVLKVGPNPVQETLTVDWSAYEVTHPTIKIFSMDGKLQWQGVDLQGSQVEVDVSSFSNGIFMMHIYTGDKPVMLKVIKE